MLSRRSFLKFLVVSGAAASVPGFFTTARSVLFPIKSFHGTAPTPAELDNLLTVTIDAYRDRMVENIMARNPLFDYLNRKEDSGP